MLDCVQCTQLSFWIPISGKNKNKNKTKKQTAKLFILMPV